jgi:hypothetical protein
MHKDTWLWKSPHTVSVTIGIGLVDANMWIYCAGQPRRSETGGTALKSGRLARSLKSEINKGPRDHRGGLDGGATRHFLN